MNSPIVVVGSSNIDMVLQLDRIPRPGETLLGGQFSMVPGGKGANQAVAAARAGGLVSFVTRIGEDALGKLSLSGFRKDKIHVDHVIVDNTGSTGTALIFVSKDGENSIGVASGVNSHLSPHDVLNAKKHFASAKIVLLQLETPLEAIIAAVDLARSLNVPVILNPAPAQPLPPDLLQRVSILTPNEHEAGLLSGIEIKCDQSANAAANVLRSQGVETVIITMGSRGALVANSSTTVLVPSCAVDVVDTTAAGDTFNGALAVAIAEGRDLLSAIEFANAAAALSVTKLGAQPSIPMRDEIEALVVSCHSRQI